MARRFAPTDVRAPVEAEDSVVRSFEISSYMANHLSPDDVTKVADLARLELSAPETKRLTGQLNDILVQFARLQELDTEGVEPTAHSAPTRNVLREDIVGESLSRQLATSNAPERRDGNFIVPQVVEQ